MFYQLKRIKYRFSLYLQEIRDFKKECPQHSNIWILAKRLPLWMRKHKDPLSEELPWLTFGAILFLEHIVTKDIKVYEYGAGGSTLFFSKHCKEVISVEHNKAWYNKVTEIVRKRGYKNCKVALLEPATERVHADEDISDPNTYASSDESYSGKSFKEYAMSVEKYSNEYFDLVLVDGRARPSCFKHAIKKVKKGGFLILDDAARTHYLYVQNSLDNNVWKKYTFCGRSLYDEYDEYFIPKCTHIWKRLK